MRFLIFASLFFLVGVANATTYRCEPEFQTVFGNRVQNNDFIKSFKPYTLVREETDGRIERCSYSNLENKHVCEKYKTDRFESDSNALVKKFYVFQSQYDIQIFRELSYIDNNGRGGMLYGKCKIVTP